MSPMTERADTMNFQIKALPAELFNPLFDLSDEELAARQIVRKRADRSPGFPCRVSLQDAEPGETVLLVNFEHLPVASPYRSRHAIYVRQNAVEARLAINEVPRMLQTRLLSVRAFDVGGMMTDADVIPGSELAGRIAIMFSDKSVSYLHVHNAKPGCFAARVDRSGPV
jgi:Protein of unknown function (DUF1203)